MALATTMMTTPMLHLVFPDLSPSRSTEPAIQGAEVR
jgi:hypothetical protein